MKKSLLSLACVLGMAACAEDVAEEPVHLLAQASLVPEEIYYDHIHSGSKMFYYPISFCRLAAETQTAGVYRVTELRGVSESLPGVTRKVAATYAKFELVEAWSADADKEVVARLNGGPLFDEDVTEQWTVALSVGEELGVLFEPASASNRGYPRVTQIRTFRQGAHGGLSNGQLFTRSVWKRNDIATAFSTATSGPCPNELQPDYRQARPQLPHWATTENVAAVVETEVAPGDPL